MTRFLVTMVAKAADDVRTTIEVTANSPVEAKEAAETARPEFTFVRARALIEPAEKDEYGWFHDDHFNLGE